MFYFSWVLVTGLCSVEESSLSCTHMLYEIFVYMLYFNNFFFKKKGQRAFFKEAVKPTNRKNTKSSLSYFVVKNKDLGSVPLL